MSNPTALAAPGKSPLVELGLKQSAIDDLIGKLFPTDGDTSFEELRCVGLYPEADLIQAVLTVKKSSGYSGGLCGNGSIEYVAFWIDFNDGSGFQYQGTATVNVFDLQTIPDEDVQYAVFLKTDLSKFRVPCEAGPRIVRLRGILSWATAPPPGNPNYVPVWGNREECRVQLHPGKLEGHIPLIETVGDILVPDINPVNGLATGDGQIGAFSVVDSPFGGEVRITGRIGNPPNSFGGGATPFKYRVEVFGPAPFNTWTPLTNPIVVGVSEWFNGNPVMCAPGDFVCDTTLTPTDDGDGFGPGWYTYLEDIQGVNQRFLVVDKLASWFTNAGDGRPVADSHHGEGSIGADAVPGLPDCARAHRQHAAVGTGRAWRDAGADRGEPAADDYRRDAQRQSIAGGRMRQVPVGSIITGTYEVHDPGLTSPNQHFSALSLTVTPAGPANGVTPSPSSRSYPLQVPTTGEAGNWTLDTHGMDPCGYVIRLYATDRTNVNSTGNAYDMAYDVGFCLEPA